MKRLKLSCIFIFIFSLLILTTTDQVRSQTEKLLDIEQLYMQAENVLLQSLDDRSQQVQLVAFNRLTLTLLPKAIPKILELLRNGNKEMRAQAAKVLGHGPTDPFTTQALIERLQNDTDFLVRQSAALSLAQIRAESAIPALMETLKNDSETIVRAAAVTALGLLRASKAIPLLKETMDKLLTHSRDNRLEEIERQLLLGNIIGALASLQDASILPILPTYFGASSSPDEVSGAFSSTIALQIIAAATSIGGDLEFADKIREALKPLLKHQRVSVRLKVSLVLRMLGDTTATKSTIESLSVIKNLDDFERDLQLLEFSFFSIAGLAIDATLVPIISEILDILTKPTDSPFEFFLRDLLRGFLTYALAHIGNEEAIRKLIQILKEPIKANPLTDIELAKELMLLALGIAVSPRIDKISHAEIVMPVLNEFTENNSAKLRARAASSIGASDNASGLVSLLKLLEDKSIVYRPAEVRESAIEALGALGLTQALPALSTFLGDSNKVVRTKAAGSILQILNRQNQPNLSVTMLTQANVFIPLTELPLMSKMMLSLTSATACKVLYQCD